MPIYIKKDIKINHIHIPKCAGTSIENFFINKKFDYAMLDRNFNQKNQEALWSKSPPQHIPAYSFLELFREVKFNFTFAVVRNPINRFKSAFIFHFVKNRMPEIKDINHFVDFIYQNKGIKIHWLNNHFLPMSFFIENIPNVKIYHLENGLNTLESDLAELLKLKEKIVFEKENSQKNINPKLINLSHESISKLSKIYALDFEKFGY